MLRVIFSLVLSGAMSLGYAKEPEAYQVDLLVFTHDTVSSTVSLETTLSKIESDAITLNTQSNRTPSWYQLLPTSASLLREEYWALHRKSEYRIVLNYSWLQPMNNQKTIVLPRINREGIDIEGSIKIKRANYYLLDTQLLLTNLNTNQDPFVFAQKQRLKANQLYYFDHPQAGMLIKIHPPA